MGTDILVTGLSTIAGSAATAGAAYGVLKQKLKNSLTFREHSELCAEQREEHRKEIEAFRVILNDVSEKVNTIHGFIQGRNGGHI